MLPGWRKPCARCDRNDSSPASEAQLLGRYDRNDLYAWRGNAPSQVARGGIIGVPANRHKASKIDPTAILEAARFQAAACAARPGKV